MAAKILSGKVIAEKIRTETGSEVRDLHEVHGFSPRLVVVRVGEDPASAVYVNSKVRTAGEMGIESDHIHFDQQVSEAQLIETVDELNHREDVDGILVQLPLPPHIAERAVLERVDPQKDVDGFHPLNAGRLMQGYPALAPCTPAGVIEILLRSGIPITGKHAVVVGRSNIVGKPLAMLLLRENATVTICHSRTTDLASITSTADILVAAIGRAGFIRSEHIQNGATVIDVGINNLTDVQLAAEMFPAEELQKRKETIEKRGFTLVGDVRPKDAAAKAGAYTPVPGGVGLLTVAMLMKNTVTAARIRRGV